MRQCDKETYSVSKWQYCLICLFLQLHLKINCSHLHTYSDLYGHSSFTIDRLSLYMLCMHGYIQHQKVTKVFYNSHYNTNCNNTTEIWQTF